MSFDHGSPDNINDINFADFILLPEDPVLSLDSLDQQDDSNTFDSFSPSFAESYIDPRQLSAQWSRSYASSSGTDGNASYAYLSGTDGNISHAFSSGAESNASCASWSGSDSNASPSSVGSSHLPSPTTSTGLLGEVDTHLRPAKGLHLPQDGDEEVQTRSDLLRLTTSPSLHSEQYPYTALSWSWAGLIDDEQAQELNSGYDITLCDSGRVQREEEDGELPRVQDILHCARPGRTQAGLHLGGASLLQAQHATELTPDVVGSSSGLPSLSIPQTSPQSLPGNLPSQDILPGLENAVMRNATTSSQDLGRLATLDDSSDEQILEGSSARASLLKRAARQGLSLHRSTLTSISTGEDSIMASVVDDTWTKTGLASMRMILKEASRACTPRGVMPAFEDPSLFGERRSPVQAHPTTGTSTSTEQSGARSKRCPSPSGELFRLRRRISSRKDDDFIAGRQYSRSMSANPKQPEISSLASYIDANGSHATTNDHLAHRQEEAPSSTGPRAKAVHEIISDPGYSSSSTGEHALATITDVNFDEAALQPRYKEYQRIDRFWVRDHHGRRTSSLPLAVALLGLLLVAAVLPVMSWPALTTAAVCLALQGSLQDQRSAATRFANNVAARKSQFLRHMAGARAST